MSHSAPRASAYKSIFLTAKAQKAKKEGKTEGFGHKTVEFCGSGPGCRSRTTPPPPQNSKRLAQQVSAEQVSIFLTSKSIFLSPESIFLTPADICLSPADIRLTHSV
jgi:hypothetical protein